ncbi:TRAP transporter small permease [Paracoccus sp. Z330]|uniref:TRAP transporter small permease protein n=1 Tax=Paracoccus onchidii TaxID=3017813 RepID=A0ABT4ZI13_9RHOB|nr:TRAP transporter small permease [Paracoccus onchidii]MDB6178381.1 TRAP transporter small permease [Paracoccus onchidii]
MGSKLRAALDRIDFAIAYLATIGIVGVTILGIVMRYVVGAPLTWLEEVQMMLIVWLVMFGGSAAFRLNQHVAIDAVVDTLPHVLQRLAQWVVAVVVLVSLGFLVYAGSKFVSFQFGAARVTDVLGIPYGWIYLALPAGGGMMMISYFLTTVLPMFSGATEPLDGERHV